MEFLDELLWQSFSRHLPLWLKPNHFTLLRLFLLAPLAIYFVLVANYLLSFSCCLLGAFFDLLDGNLARKRKEISHLGKILDPLADKFLLFPFAILAFSHLNFWLFCFYFLGEGGVIFLNFLIFLKKKIKKGSLFFGKLTFGFLFLTLFPLLFLFPKNPFLIFILNCFLLLGTILRWISFGEYLIYYLRSLSS